MLRACLLAVIAIAAVGCGPGIPGGPTMNNKVNPPAPASRVVSTDILAREPRTNRTRVKHILIGWSDLEGSYQGGIDPRAAKRSKRDAENEVEALLAELAAGADFDALMRTHSEDKGSTSNPDGYEVFPGAGLVLEFRSLGLRLDVGEIGVVESTFGFHIMKRHE